MTTLAERLVMSDLVELRVKSRSFPEMGSLLAALGFEAAAALRRGDWKSYVTGRWKARGVDSVMPIASALLHNPFA